MIRHFPRRAAKASLSAVTAMADTVRVVSLLLSCPLSLSSLPSSISVSTLLSLPPSRTMNHLSSRLYAVIVPRWIRLRTPSTVSLNRRAASTSDTPLSLLLSSLLSCIHPLPFPSRCLPRHYSTACQMYVHCRLAVKGENSARSPAFTTQAKPPSRFLLGGVN